LAFIKLQTEGGGLVWRSYSEPLVLAPKDTPCDNFTHSVILARMSYYHPNSIVETCGYQWNTKLAYVTEPVAAYVHACDAYKTIAVTFRGTVMDSMKDLLVNLDTSEKLCASVIGGLPGNCHNGYLEEYDSVKYPIRNALTEYLGPATTSSRFKVILFAGHSQGGAISNMAAFDAAVNQVPCNKKIVMAMTIGAPAVFSSDAHDSFRENVHLSYQYINQGFATPFGGSYVREAIATKYDLLYYRVRKEILVYSGFSAEIVVECTTCHEKIEYLKAIVMNWNNGSMSGRYANMETANDNPSSGCSIEPPVDSLEADTAGQLTVTSLSFSSSTWVAGIVALLAMLCLQG